MTVKPVSRRCADRFNIGFSTGVRSRNIYFPAATTVAHGAVVTTKVRR
jgi:hypothetical protein